MKVAMVSGAGRGIGAAIAVRLLADAWALSLGLRDPARAGRFSHVPADRLLAFPFDATLPETAAPWAAATIARFGHLDALIKNAGILRVVDVEKGTENEMWMANVKAPFRLIRAALPHLRLTGQRRVVSIASTDAKRYRAGVSIGYTMTKHVLHVMTTAVRFATRDDGVRATAICPCATDADLIANVPGATPTADRLTPETVVSMLAFALSLPNQASVPEFIANTRLENTQ